MLTSTFAARAADAMLRALGGAELILRIPSAAIPPESAVPAGLGLTAPMTDDIVVSPAMVRPLDRVDVRAIEAIFSVDSLAPHLERSGLGVEDFLAACHGIVETTGAPHFAGGEQKPGSRLLRITRVSVERFAGQEYLVRLEATV